MNKVLITAGGTNVPIDDVRCISNFSSGNFAAELADAALKAGEEVIYLHAKHAKMPLAKLTSIDVETAVGMSKKALKEQKLVADDRKGRLETVAYSSYDEYAQKLEEIIQSGQVSMVFLAAAVSDYGVDKIPGKISSDNESQVITLKKLPKLISQIKNWSKNPIFQVGFKLLSDVSKEELIDVAYRAGLKNHSDLTFANDLAEIRAGKRNVTIVTPEKGAINFIQPNLAEQVFAFAARRQRTQHFRTKLVKNSKLAEQYKTEAKVLSTAVKRLAEKNLLVEFYDGAKQHHGSVSVRTRDGFLITARQSNKEDLNVGDIVRVDRIKWARRRIVSESVSGLKKPSFNALLSSLVFEQFPEVNIIVHTHSFAKGAPTTEFPETPGTIEYARTAVELLKKSKTINLANHGQVTITGKLEEVL
jgi:phosphopantothenate-cysteine ligase